MVASLTSTDRWLNPAPALFEGVGSKGNQPETKHRPNLRHILRNRGDECRFLLCHKGPSGVPVDSGLEAFAAADAKRLGELAGRQDKTIPSLQPMDPDVCPFFFFFSFSEGFSWPSEWE